MHCRLSIPAACGLVLLVSACDDAANSPFASVAAGDTRGALELTTELGTPADWASLDDGETLAGLSTWEESWTLPTEQGRPSREGGYAELVRALADGTDRDEIDGWIDALESALDEAESVPATEMPEWISDRLTLARDAQLRARRALAIDQPLRALTEVLRGTDLLREVEPQQVATQLVAAADEGMRRLLGSETYSEETRERAQSLIRIARTAMRDGDFTKAIQSAYYATRVLEVEVN